MLREHVSCCWCLRPFIPGAPWQDSGGETLPTGVWGGFLDLQLIRWIPPSNPISTCSPERERSASLTLLLPDRGVQEPSCLSDSPQSLTTKLQADPMASLDLAAATGEAIVGLHGCSCGCLWRMPPSAQQGNTGGPEFLRSLRSLPPLFLFPENLPLSLVRKSSSLTEGITEGNQDAFSAHIGYSPKVHHPAPQLVSPFPVLTAKPPLSARDTRPLTGSLGGPSQVGL